MPVQRRRLDTQLAGQSPGGQPGQPDLVWQDNGIYGTLIALTGILFPLTTIMRVTIGAQALSVLMIAGSAMLAVDYLYGDMLRRATDDGARR